MRTHCATLVDAVKIPTLIPSYLMYYTVARADLAGLCGIPPVLRRLQSILLREIDSIIMGTGKDAAGD
jgi:hypothetical protein